MSDPNDIFKKIELKGEAAGVAAMLGIDQARTRPVPDSVVVAMWAILLSDSPFSDPETLATAKAIMGMWLVTSAKDVGPMGYVERQEAMKKMVDEK